MLLRWYHSCVKGLCRQLRVRYSTKRVRRTAPENLLSVGISAALFLAVVIKPVAIRHRGELPFCLVNTAGNTS